MTPVEKALALAAEKFHVFPLQVGGKLPAIEDFPNKATRDPAVIRQLWCAEIGTDPMWHHQYNVGIYTGRFGDPREDGSFDSLVCLDVDRKNGKDGLIPLKALREATPGLVPPTYVQTTPTGGYHYVYRTSEHVKNSVGKIGVGLDVRGVGGFIVGAGSIVEAGTYGVANAAPVAVASPALIELCGRHVPKEARPVSVVEIDETAATARVRDYLAHAAPAVEGNGGNAHSFAVAARCKDLGTDSDTTLALMIEDGGWNDRCTPPWEPCELERIVQNAFAYGRNAQGSAAPEAAFTAVVAPVTASAIQGTGQTFAGTSDSDADLALAVAQRHHGRVLWVEKRQLFFWFNGHFWLQDEINVVRGMVHAFLLERGHAIKVAARGGDSKSRERAESRSNHLQSARVLSNVLFILKSLPSVAAHPNDFDRDPALMGTPSGTADLKTGTTRAADPADRITKSAGAVPGGKCPKWLKFFFDFTGGDLEKMAYLKRLLGYSITAEMSEHVIVFFHGSGGNGKSVFTAIWYAAAGGYACAISDRALIQSANPPHASVLAAMLGKRVGFLNEVPAGARFNEPEIKKLSSGDPTGVNFMRGDTFDMKPTAKIIITGNNRPTLSNVDRAIRRRFHMVDCCHRPTTINPNLIAELMEELPGILQWMIEGAAEWYRVGLCPPPSVLAATEKYFESEDKVGQWLADRTEKGADFFTPTTALYDDLRRYAATHGFTPPGLKQMGEDLEKRDYKSFRRQSRNPTDAQPNGRGFEGLRLRESAADQPSNVLPFCPANSPRGAE